MINNQDKIDSFKKIVIKNCSRNDFEYRDWFVKDHLMIVERIAIELCDIYIEADRELVSVLIWFHDFGKPIDGKNEYEATRTKGMEALRAVGFENNFIQRVLEAWERIEKKKEVDISKESIEVQIISLSDGAAHFVGKFYSTYFQDDSGESIDSLEKRIKDKITKDWKKKIVLPELKKAFKSRYLQSLEIAGEYPEKFIS